MVSKTEDYVAWVSLVQELDDAREHLVDLLREMTEDPAFDEGDLRIRLGHVFSHLNRAWNTRNATSPQVTDPSPEQWEAWSRFPTDLEPV
jgi:hypothetical protein